MSCDERAAGAAYEEMIDPATAPARKPALERAARRYCLTDTLAMAKVWEVLERRVRAKA